MMKNESRKTKNEIKKNRKWVATGSLDTRKLSVLTDFEQRKAVKAVCSCIVRAMSPCSGSRKTRVLSDKYKVRQDAPLTLFARGFQKPETPSDQHDRCLHLPTSLPTFAMQKRSIPSFINHCRGRWRPSRRSSRRRSLCEADRSRQKQTEADSNDQIPPRACLPAMPTAENQVRSKSPMHHLPSDSSAVPASHPCPASAAAPSIAPAGAVGAPSTLRVPASPEQHQLRTLARAYRGAARVCQWE